MIPRRLEPEVMDSVADARDYDAMDHTGPNTAFVERLLELGAAGQMLDIGTGPGHVPLMVCDRHPGARVVAVDLAQEMLRLAQAKRAASPHAQRIRFEQADAKQLPYADASFDAVFSNTIVHHLPEPVPMLCEAWRVLRPGGVLLIRDLYRPETEAAIQELVALHAGNANGHARRLFADSFHAALTPDEFRLAAKSAGITGAEVVIDTDRHMSLQTPAKGA